MPLWDIACIRAWGAYLHLPIESLMFRLVTIQTNFHEKLPLRGAHNDVRRHVGSVVMLWCLKTEQRNFPILGRWRGKRRLDLLSGCKRMLTLYKVEATISNLIGMIDSAIVGFDPGWRLGDGISSLDQWKEQRYYKRWLPSLEIFPYPVEWSSRSHHNKRPRRRHSNDGGSKPQRT